MTAYTEGHFGNRGAANNCVCQLSFDSNFSGFSLVYFFIALIKNTRSSVFDDVRCEFATGASSRVDHLCRAARTQSAYKCLHI